MRMSQTKQVEEKPQEIASNGDPMRRENALVENQQTVQFLDESNKIEVQVEKSTEKVPQLFRSPTLSEFLSRPFSLSTFLWKREDVAGSCVYRAALPDALFEIPSIWKKLANFTYFRSGLKVQIRVNGTLYHYGMLLAVWRPFALGKTTRASGATASPTSFDNVHTLSQYPSTLVSANSSDVVDLEIPWFSLAPWLHLEAFSETSPSEEVRKLYSLGIFELWVVNPLISAGESTDTPISVTVYASFVQPELEGRTYKSLNYKPLALPRLTDTFRGLYLSIGVPSEQSSAPDSTSSAPAAKTPRPKAQAGSGSGDDEVQERPSSSIATATLFPQDIASMSSHLPSLSLSTKPIFNSSSPSILSVGNPSFIDFVSKPSLILMETIPPEKNSGDVLLRLPVSPMLYSWVVNNGRRQFHSRLSYLSSFFSLWSGDITFTFQVVCSKFHSTRLRFTWVPTVNNDVKKPLHSAEYSLAHHKVVDIQGETEVNLTVPFLYPFRAAPIHRGNEVSDSSNGVLVVSLMNRLAYPAPKIPPIYLNVWISSKNLHLSRLRPLSERKDNVLETGASRTSLQQRAKAQGGVGTGDDPPDRIGIDALPLSIASAGDLIGEGNSSFSDLIRKPSFVRKVDPGKYLDLPLVHVPEATGDIRLTSLLQYLSMAFAAYAGSVRFIVPYSAGASILAIPRLTNAPATASTDEKAKLVDYLESETVASVAFFPNYFESHKSFILPFYSTLSAIPTTLFPRAGTAPDDIRLPMVSIHAFGNTEPVPILSSAGEDFQLLGPLGAPMLTES
ncbi:structural polyprotein [Blackbird arilivirus]|uniref:structural polyprotein n=1 Tax=Blackbird arilivirus TaxID=2099352 RepID=UPI000D21EE7F|nr:structural polyprotein [Blackbird arilivirus]AVH80932.1 structural polyprotein [Blackbird arilivirus]